MITKSSLNRNLLHAEYAVRGPIVTRAQQLEIEGRKIIYANVGNPQALRQRPVRFVRQVMSLLEYPDLLDRREILSGFPSDVVEKARQILKEHPHGTGAYTQSAGIPFIRRAVADFIRSRDGIETSESRIILNDGASKGVQAAILSLLREPHDGIMIPIPQYPLYSATITLYGGRQIGYYLDESNHWQLNAGVLEKSVAEARAVGINPVAIAVINPGNPTGGVLSYENIAMVIRFAREHNLSILADEVYQENIYTDRRPFTSFAKVMNDVKEDRVTLFSFHSVSKGFLGECGHRGGYTEFRNIPDEAMSEMVKLQSISLCANVPGQIATYLMVSPPSPGDESYDTFRRERDGILASLKRKAELLGEGINAIEGMSLDSPEGAMYAFVRVQLPEDPAVDAVSMSPRERVEHEAKRDSAYCMALLEETGICVVPGSGFGQMPGTYHFRTTFLPPEDDIQEFVVALRQFHEQYIRELRGIVVQ